MNNELFDKYPYVYSCCPETIDGLTQEAVMNSYANGSIVEGQHVGCLSCGKIYHAFKLGLKWTEVIATQNQINEGRKMRNDFLALHASCERNDGVTKIIEQDLSRTTCKICGKLAFANESQQVINVLLDTLNAMLESSRKNMPYLSTEELKQAVLMSKEIKCTDCIISKRTKQIQSNRPNYN